MPVSFCQKLNLLSTVCVSLSPCCLCHKCNKCKPELSPLHLEIVCVCSCILTVEWLSSPSPPGCGYSVSHCLSGTSCLLEGESTPTESPPAELQMLPLWFTSIFLHSKGFWGHIFITQIKGLRTEDVAIYSDCKAHWGFVIAGYVNKFAMTDR